MTRTFSTTADSNDIFIAEDGKLAISEGIDAVANACRNVSLAQLGEEVLTTTQGLPNFSAVWVGSPNYALYQSYLRNALLGVPGVTAVKSISLSAQNNVLNYTATIVTQFGPAEISSGAA